MFKFLLRRLRVALTFIVLLFGAFIGKAQCPIIKATSLTVVTFKFPTHFGGTITLLTISTVNGSSSFSGSEIISANDSTVTVDLAVTTTGPANDSTNTATFSHASDGFLDQDCYVGQILPLTLLKFIEEKRNDGSTLFHWQTAHEINIDHFELQESKDGKNWLTIHNRKAGAKSLNINNYSFDYNKSIAENKFFRLKIVDKGEVSFFYSKIIYVKRDGTNPIKFYPNPATDVLNIEGAFSSLVIIDQFGNTVLTSTEKKINVSFLSPGLYSVQTFDKLEKPHKPLKLVKN